MGKIINKTQLKEDYSGDDINLLDYLLIVVKHKKIILVSCALAFFFSCGITLLMSDIFSSTARILPPQDNKEGFSSVLGKVGELTSLTGFPFSGGNSGELYVGMLKSRTIADAIIDQFELMKVYDQEYRVKTLTELEEHVNIILGTDDGIISITVEDEDPKRAAAIANAYIEELKKLNVKLNLSSAGRERNFLENRLVIVKRDLINAEERLQKFQEENKAFKIDEQAMAIISSISQLKGELASKEVELGVLRSFQTAQNPQVRALQESIVQLKEQIARLERSPKGEKVAENTLIATSDVPELWVQYARLMRDYKTQEALFELLTKQYEVAKINEAKNTSMIQVLDDAFIPDKKSRPSRSYIVVLTTLLVGFLSILAAFVLEYGNRMPEDDWQRWQKIRELAMTGKGRRHKP